MYHIGMIVGQGEVIHIMQDYPENSCLLYLLPKITGSPLKSQDLPMVQNAVQILQNWLYLWFGPSVGRPYSNNVRCHNVALCAWSNVTVDAVTSLSGSIRLLSDFQRRHSFGQADSFLN